MVKWLKNLSVLKQKQTMILSRLFNSDGFRIYFWPIFIYWLLIIGCLFFLLPIEPESQKEYVFTIVGSVALLALLWILVGRYERIKGKALGKTTKALLIFLTAICLFGLMFTVLKIAH